MYTPWKIYLAFCISFLIASCNNEPKGDPCSGMEAPYGFRDLKFDSVDGLEIDARIYLGVSNDFRLILMFHQAGSNKREYCSIAAKLAGMGYNCLVADLRSGGDAFGGQNLTHQRATEEGRSTEYVEAYKDMMAVLNFGYEKSRMPVYIVGSSYTAGLALQLAKNDPRVAKVAAFSPGEYYGEDYKLQPKIDGLNIPVFATSSKKEADESMEQLLSAVDQSKLTWFIPESKGGHGAKVLWETDPNKDEYWEAFLEWLKN